MPFARATSDPSAAAGTAGNRDADIAGAARCSPSRGRPGRAAAVVTRSSITSTATTRPGGRCAGIDEQVAMAEKAIARKTPVKRIRFIRLSGGTRAVNRDLEAKARAGGPEGHVDTCGPARTAHP